MSIGTFGIGKVISRLTGRTSQSRVWRTPTTPSPTGYPGPSRSASRHLNFFAEPSMAIPALARDFREFLKLLNSKSVEYLLVGGYAVGIHGYVRTTNDLDVWVNIDPGNARRLDQALREFGFDSQSLSPELFLVRNTVVRLGVPPIRVEILTSISGLEFEECYAERFLVTIDEMPIPVIGLAHLRQNKRASGRAKDIADLENLPLSPLPSDQP